VPPDLVAINSGPGTFDHDAEHRSAIDQVALDEEIADPGVQVDAIATEVVDSVVPNGHAGGAVAGDVDAETIVVIGLVVISKPVTCT
jgi:hypothetical protein